MAMMIMAAILVIADVRVEHGTLMITGYERCQFSVNGDPYMFESPGKKYIHPTVVMGLIKWKCGTEYGNIIADIECKPCGIYCAYNQQFEKCKSSWGPAVLGVSIVLILWLVLIIMCLTCLKTYFKKSLTWIFYRILTRNDRLRAKKVLLLNKMTGTQNPILFRTIITTDTELNKMIMDSRMALRKKITGDEPIYEEICKGDKYKGKFTFELEDRIMKNKFHRIGEEAAAKAARRNSGSSTVAKIVTAACALNGGIGTTYACDKTLFLSSSGKICDDNNCMSINMYSIPLQSGSVICFTTMLGDKLELKIADSHAISRYHSEYYACSFGITTESAWECKSPASNCWNHGTCVPGHRHESMSEELTYPHGYGCNSDSVGCDTYCWHQTSCTWYKRVAHPNREKCYRVYRKVSEIWETILHVTYKGIVKKIKLNTNNPEYNLGGSDIQGLTKMPIIITSFNYESLHLKNSIVYADKAYGVDSSDINFPIKNTIGEYQMSLDKKTYTMYTSNIDCKVSSCMPNCSIDAPAVSRLAETKSLMIPGSQIKSSGDMVVKRYIPISATANMMLGSIKIDSLKVTPSHCKISVENQYARIGCDMKPYVVIKPYEIKNEGLLEYESNCSWTKQYMSCNFEPYTMTLEENADSCLINIPSINQTLHIRFDYEFVGQLSLLKTYYSESVSDSFKSMVSDKTFWQSIIGSLNIMGVLSVSTVAIFKAVRLAIAYKTERNIDKV